ncbi:MAG: DegT/DnrJ/EryC1/StrS family aminotransferase [Spirochaetia bacterium]|nr:DegT/DnrJ/EryC1/StrS family aminotransferase [Spirochaetia bacterium]
MWKVQLFKLDYGEAEKQALMDVLDSGWITMGEKTKTFEEEFSKYLGGGVSSLAVSSCTAGLHMALLALGIGPGDEVMVPASTFIADLNVVMMVGATPVSIDAASLDDWNISVVDMKRKITKKTKAIIALHFAGHPFDPKIIEIARENNILIIEDVAHAIGGSRNGKMCGTWGDVSAFSFFANKNLAVGEGGMFVAADPNVFDKGRFLRSHGMSTLSFDRHEGRAISYDVLQPGLNYRMDEFRAALGQIQLAKLNENNLKRKKLVQRYQQLLKGTPLQIPFQDIPENTTFSYHIFPVLLPAETDRLAFIGHMKQAQVQTSIHYPAYREFTYYKNIIKEPTPVSDEISARVVTLPLYPTMTQEQVELVCHSVANFFR